MNVRLGRISWASHTAPTDQPRFYIGSDVTGDPGWVSVRGSPLRKQLDSVRVIPARVGSYCLLIRDGDRTLIWDTEEQPETAQCP